MQAIGQLDPLTGRHRQVLLQAESASDEVLLQAIFMVFRLYDDEEHEISVRNGNRIVTWTEEEAE